MGEAKYNPTAIKFKNAKDGEFPPRPPRPSKAETERFFSELCQAYMCQKIHEVMYISDELMNLERRKNHDH